ncbi:MAG: hypothetical protein WCG75_06030 [Armatimonadota bacterium]
MKPSVYLILIGAGLGLSGIDTMRSHEGVAGGPMIWVLYFGGSLLFIGCGLWLLVKDIAKKEK